MSTTTTNRWVDEWIDGQIGWERLDMTISTWLIRPLILLSCMQWDSLPAHWDWRNFLGLTFDSMANRLQQLSFLDFMPPVLFTDGAYV